MDFIVHNGRNSLTTYNTTSSMKTICVRWSFPNGLIATKKNPYMVVGVMWDLLLIGFQSYADLSWLVTFLKFFMNKIICSNFTFFSWQ
jgi:hypothetical protein